MLEALFAARTSAKDAANVDVDEVFGDRRAADAQASVDALLRAAALPPEVAAMLAQVKADTGRRSSQATARNEVEAAGRAGAGLVAPPSVPASRNVDHSAAEAPVLVRNLVQAVYETRGFRAVPTGASTRPIELVLTHRSDPHRAYALAAVTGEISAAVVQTIVERAHAIGQRRVLIASERPVAQALDASSIPPGVRILDSAAIDAKLARLDAGLAARLREAAQRRGGRRMVATD